mgnify:CR=1 FL=1
MARLQHSGFDWGTTPSTTAAAGANRQFVGGRRKRGMANAYRDNVSINSSPQEQIDTPGTTRSEGYERFYIRRMTAVSVQKRVYGIHGSVEGSDDAVVVELGTAGQLKFYNWGNWVSVGGGNETPTTGQLLGSSSALTIGQWYRVELHWRFFVGGGPLLEVRLDGTGVSLAAFSSQQFGLNHHTSQAQTRTFGGGVASTAAWDLDDVAFDTAGWIGDTEVLQAPITGIGHYNTGWTTAGGAVNPHNFTAVPYNIALTGAPYSMDCSTPSGQISFTLMPFADMGINPDTGQIFGISVSTMAASNGGANVQIFIRKNGTDTYSPSMDINSSQGVHRYYWSAATLGGLLVTDTVEVGLRHDPVQVTNCPVGGLFVDVEASNVADVEELTGVVQIAKGTYTGDGLTQDINVGFRPDFILVYGASTASTGPRFWWQGVYGAGTASAVQSVPWPGLLDIGATGFTVTGNGLAFNAVSNTYTWVAISDPNGRVFDRDGFWKKTGSSWDQPLVDPTFTPEFLWVAPIYIPSSPQAVMARFSSQTGTNSSFLSVDTADATDAIQSMGAGTFNLGTRVDRAPRTFAYAAFRTHHFLQRRLIYVGSYTGDGTSNRVLPVTILANPLKWAMVVPTNAERRVFKDDTMATEESHYFFSDQIFTTAAGGSLITALTPTSITVKGGASAGLNTSGVLYNILAFTTGTDEPAVSNATLTMSAANPLTPMKVFGAGVNSDTNAVMLMSRIPDGVEGSIYEGLVAATSVPVAIPWTYDVLGDLPDGLTLDANTGTITGIATRRGEYTFSIRASHRD